VARLIWGPEARRWIKKKGTGLTQISSAGRVPEEGEKKVSAERAAHGEEPNGKLQKNHARNTKKKADNETLGTYEKAKRESNRQKRVELKLIATR